MGIELDFSRIRGRKLFVATPMYGGQCAGIYTRSMVGLADLCVKAGIELIPYYLLNESLVTRCRNYCCDEFVRSGFDHFMFIDSDIAFNPMDVLALMALQELEPEKYEIIGGPYAKKVISWEKIKQAVDKGFADEDPSVLERFVGDYVFNPKFSGEYSLSNPVEVLEIGTGFMMITREALKKFADFYPQYMYRPDHVRSEHFDGTREIMMYFQAEIDPRNKRYLSEDYWFCLASGSQIETENGLQSIKSIVDSKYSGKVKSLDKNNNIVWNNVINHWSRPNGKRGDIQSKKKWVRILTQTSNNKRFNLVCTDDHKIAVSDSIFDINVKYVAAKDTKDKYSIRLADEKNNALYNKEQMSALIGTILGDGYISSIGQVSFTHSINQEEYIKFKNTLFGGKIAHSVNRGFGLGKQAVILTLPINQQTKDLRSLMYVDGKKSIKNVIDMVDPIALALWYMDDGSFGKNGNARLSTASFDITENNMIKDMLMTKFGIESSVKTMWLDYNNEKRQYHYISLTAKGRDIMMNLISPYIISSMGYKVPSNYENMVASHSYDEKMLDISSSKIKDVKYLPNYSSRLYDIEVENTHNFIANQTVVHNCQKAQEAGIKTYLCPWMKLQHVGSYIFGGSLVDLAQIGANATCDPSLLKKSKKSEEPKN